MSPELDPKNLNVADAIETMDAMTLFQAEDFVKRDDTGSGPRKGLLAYLEGRRKCEALSTESATPIDRQTYLDAIHPLPKQFVMLQGGVKSFVLQGDSVRVTADGQKVVTRGVRITTRKIGRTGLGLIDIPTLECCLRADNRMDPQEVARMIIASKFFQNGKVVPKNLYEEEQAARLKLAQVHKEAEKELERQMTAKRGKLGAPASV